VNLKDINAFALPGGPMFVQRGMFDAAAEEAEVAGVMAHELSRVLLRHGTANASKAQNPWLQLGQIVGAVGGAVGGGELGGYIAEGTQLGLGTLLLRYSRDYEKQADLLGRADHGAGQLRPARARSCAKSKRVNSAQQDRNLVPNGAVLVHQPPLWFRRRLPTVAQSAKVGLQPSIRATVGKPSELTHRRRMRTVPSELRLASLPCDNHG